LIRSGTKENIKSFEFLRDFPEALRIEMDRMPTRSKLIEAMQVVGLVEVSLQSVEQVSANNYEEYYEKVKTRGFPSFALISDDEFKNGLDNFGKRCHSKGIHSVPPPEVVDLVVGQKAQ
jgi:hypothetical protein